MKKILLLVALIAVGCFVASRLLKGDGGSVETEETLHETTSDADVSEGDGQAELESAAEDSVASEVAG